MARKISYGRGGIGDQNGDGGGMEACIFVYKKIHAIMGSNSLELLRPPTFCKFFSGLDWIGLEPSSVQSPGAPTIQFKIDE